jgi:nucleoside-diphosphate-sugar epimerase
MPEFWQGKKTVVTGGCGMIGSHLVELLLDAGASVKVLDNMSRGQWMKSVQDEHLEYFTGDATDVSICGLVFLGAEIVFNLAASVGGLYFNLNHQADQFYGNVQLQTVPVMAAARLGIPVFLQTSTVCVYAENFNNPAEEIYGHLARPEKANEGYAQAKRDGEKVCGWAFAGTDTRWVIARPTNVYGIRDYFDDKPHVIPALIKKITDGRPAAEVFGGGQTREFIFADDVARGMMVLAEKGERGEAYNLGTNRETQVTIAELAELIKAISGNDTHLKFIEGETGDKGRSTNSSKAHALGWRHQVGLEEGLQRVITWYLTGK